MHPDRADPVVSEVLRQPRIEAACRGIELAAGPSNHNDTVPGFLCRVIMADGRPPVRLDLDEIVDLADLRYPFDVLRVHLDTRFVRIYLNRNRSEHGREVDIVLFVLCGGSRTDAVMTPIAGVRGSTLSGAPVVPVSAAEEQGSRRSAAPQFGGRPGPPTPQGTPGSPG